jgi:hypothetical protein
VTGWRRAAAAASLAAVLVLLGGYSLWAAVQRPPAWQQDYRPPSTGAVSRAPAPDLR